MDAGRLHPTCRPGARVARLVDAAPAGLLDQVGEEAQALRRRLVNGSRVVCIGIGYPAKRFIYERLAELGVRLVLVDHPGHWSESLVDEGLAERFLPIDVGAPLEDQAAETLAHLATLDAPVDGVCTYWEETVVVAALVAATLDLPRNEPGAISRARNKRLARAASTTLGVPTPRFAPLTESGLSVAAESVGFPAIIKPELGSDASGCYRVDSLEELVEAYARIQPQIGPEMNPIFVQGTRLLLEEYLVGTEFDVDVVLWNGSSVYEGVAENWPTGEPYFSETGLHAPSLAALEDQERLAAFCVTTARALGLTLGVLHIEAKLTPDGPRVLEVNARMGGTVMRDLNLMIHGVDLVEEHVLASVGIPVHPEAFAGPRCAVAELLFYAGRTGVLASGGFLSPLAADPRLFFVRDDTGAGMSVTGPDDGFPTLLGDIALTEKDPVAAVDAIRRLAATASVPYR